MVATFSWIRSSGAGSDSMEPSAASRAATEARRARARS